MVPLLLPLLHCDAVDFADDSITHSLFFSLLLSLSLFFFFFFFISFDTQSAVHYNTVFRIVETGRGKKPEVKKDRGQREKKSVVEREGELQWS